MTTWGSIQPPSWSDVGAAQARIAELERENTEVRDQRDQERRECNDACRIVGELNNAVAELRAENAVLKANRATIVTKTRRPDLVLPPEYYEPSDELTEKNGVIATLHSGYNESAEAIADLQAELAELWIAYDASRNNAQFDLAQYQRALRLACQYESDILRSLRLPEEFQESAESRYNRYMERAWQEAGYPEKEE